jgi:hypothetical protein
MRNLLTCVIGALLMCSACAEGYINGGSELAQIANSTAPTSSTATTAVDPNAPRTFTVVNQCAQNVWVAVQSNSGLPLPSSSGFELAQGQNQTINAISNWGGRIWGRTACSFSGGGTSACETGDCGPLQCGGNGGTPPASWAEFTLSGSSGKDFYDVSLVDGYNLPVRIAPTPGGFTSDPNQGQYWCGAPTCTKDLLQSCPPELQLLNNQNQVIACKSACLAFGTSQYCCSGTNNTSATCPATSYSEVFKAACPSQYSYAYDDKTSTFTCMSSGYTVTFCPSGN